MSNVWPAAACAAVILMSASACLASELPDGFVQVKGDQFVLSSNPDRIFKVKGFNYFPQRHPWAIFSEWDPQEVQTELAIARDMNSNVIRTFVTGGEPPSQATLNAIVEFVQICKANNQKAIISLFDGYHTYPAAGSAEEAKNLAKIDAICSALKNDTGVFAWDIKNEPDWINDTYWSWSLPGAEAEAARRIDWLYRMRNRIKQVDPNHLVTVGLIFNYNNYLPTSTRTVESFVDFVCYHYYPRNYPFETFRQSIRSLKARTSKPINVEEIGHNAWGGPGATEQDQANLFAEWLQVIEEEGITGLVQWTLCDWWDQWPGPIEERYYGFLRADGHYTWKPAAYVYRDNFVVDQFGLPQDRGQISGRVTDASGEPVPGVKVTALPGSYTAQTRTDGTYSLLNVLPGSYTVRAESIGYRTAERSGVQVPAGGSVTVDFQTEAAQLQAMGLTNGGFETADLSGWTPWGQVDGTQTGPWFASITPRSGSRFLGTATNWGQKNGGVWQQVAAPQGSRLVVEVWSRTYRQGGSEGSVANRLGVDPAGGTDPTAPTVIWTPFRESPSGWERLALTVTAARPRITVFLQHRQPGDTVWAINCFDDAAVYEASLQGGEPLRRPDNWPVEMEGTVSAIFGSFYYIQDAGRAWGVRISSAAPAQTGSRVRVRGRLGSSTGERLIVPLASEVTGTGEPPVPLAMKSAAVGGEAPAGLVGIPGASGIYNSGLLVRITGRVVWANPAMSLFYLDDGSGAGDAFRTPGIRVLCNGAWIPSEGSFASVTGISTRATVSGIPARAVRVRSAEDIIIH
jgi:hypothetical protein